MALHNLFIIRASINKEINWHNDWSLSSLKSEIKFWSMEWDAHEKWLRSAVRKRVDNFDGEQVDVGSCLF